MAQLTLEIDEALKAEIEIERQQLRKGCEPLGLDVDNFFGKTILQMAKMMPKSLESAKRFMPKLANVDGHSPQSRER